jgi:hypothetical protein
MRRSKELDKKVIINGYQFPNIEPRLSLVLLKDSIVPALLALSSAISGILISVLSASLLNLTEGPEYGGRLSWGLNCNISLMKLK